MQPRTKLWLGIGAVGVIAGVLYWRRKEVSTLVLGAAAKAQAAATSFATTLLGVTNQAKWAASLYGIISKELPLLSPQSKLLMVAHAAYESGWGQKAAAARGTNNLWNLTAGSAWKGAVNAQTDADLSFNEKECAAKGRPMTRQANGKLACRIDQLWRKYDSVNEAVRDYWNFLGPTQNSGRYVKARNALEAGDVLGFANALSAAGYFTLPGAEYAKQLAGVVMSVRDRLTV